MGNRLFRRCLHAAKRDSAPEKKIPVGKAHRRAGKEQAPALLPQARAQLLQPLQLLLGSRKKQGFLLRIIQKGAINTAALLQNDLQHFPLLAGKPEKAVQHDCSSAKKALFPGKGRRRGQISGH